MSNDLRIILRRRKNIPAVDLIFGTNGDNELQDQLFCFALEMYDYVRDNFGGSLFRDKYHVVVPFKYSVNYSVIFPNRKSMKKFIVFLRIAYPS